ncbi:class I SAM-dependent methyltransferase [Oscillatoriales cyanobacterium LEGE 11467]|uniref:Class I SAM-dependent methyltransferase n=1 Tax=Zarconia navalis LEGE 11467 TaxID=1828826 RepID=A0A928VWJ0_9CYAN|nr:class I SAM-dependent methyltransferase [Zarconia navalis]MBE9039556.1 class I SAM-dependent methyltransferase [Zarconia navalis LEGE 11467]
MKEFMFDYSKLPYGEGGRYSDHNRFNWRCENLLTRHQEIIKDKVVLDLACNTGRLSYPCLVLGAKKVIGIEARQELIERGKQNLQNTEYKSKMEFIKADIFDYLSSASPQQFDVILCFGFLYHTVRQVDFFREVKRLSPQTTIIDTNVAKNYLWYGLKNFLGKPPILQMIVENPNKTSDTTDDDGIAFWPTCSFLESMFDRINYDYHQIDYRSKEIKNWSGMEDYKKGLRVSYIGHRK